MGRPSAQLDATRGVIASIDNRDALFRTPMDQHAPTGSAAGIEFTGKGNEKEGGQSEVSPPNGFPAGRLRPNKKKLACHRTQLTQRPFETKEAGWHVLWPKMHSDRLHHSHAILVDEISLPASHSRHFLGHTSDGSVEGTTHRRRHPPSSSPPVVATHRRRHSPSSPPSPSSSPPSPSSSPPTIVATHRRRHPPSSPPTVVATHRRRPAPHSRAPHILPRCLAPSSLSSPRP